MRDLVQALLPDDLSSYVLGLATVPALFALLLLGGLVLRVLRLGLRRAGLRIEFGGEDGEAYVRTYATRRITRRCGILWTGTFRNENVSYSRFAKVATARRGVCVAHVRSLAPRETT